MTRADLNPGTQCAQAIHAAIDYGLKNPELLKEWHDISNHVGILSAKNERDLVDLIRRLEKKGIDYVAFREPDLGDCITAVALEPTDEARRAVSSFPLAMKAQTPQEVFDKETGIRNLIKTMSQCPQTENQSVLDHGLSVRDYALELYDYIYFEGELSKEWRIPEWIEHYREEFQSGLLDRLTIEHYTVFHDCGKPFCLVYDEDGRKHFPNHAEISEKAYRETFGNDQVARLIGMDMDIHLLKADGLKEFSQRKEALTLLIVGLAEIHSNAKMFGGFASTSFKIKWKQIDKRGRQILKEKFQ